MVTDPSRYGREQDVDWAEGSTQLVDAGCWRDCGPWDEEFFLYSEETEFHLRAGDRGHTVRYVPSARAVHLEGGSATSVRLWPLLVANRWRLFRSRHGRGAQRPVLGSAAGARVEPCGPGSDDLPARRARAASSVAADGRYAARSGSTRWGPGHEARRQRQRLTVPTSARSARRTGGWRPRNSLRTVSAVSPSRTEKRGWSHAASLAQRRSLVLTSV